MHPKQEHPSKISREDAEEAIKTILLWIGENPDREGLVDTPKRVVRSFGEFFSGYKTDPEEILKTTFTETEDYSDMVLLKNITVESHCEHHLAPVIGVAHIAYIPQKRVVGISKLARVVEVFSKRLQLQERLTVQIANTINKVLEPKGVAVAIEATHHCITTRGIHHSSTSMYTQSMLGCFMETEIQRQFLSQIK